MKSVDILLITPPFTQINTPYPATVFLQGFLKSKGFEVAQADLGIEVIDKLFSKKGLATVFALVQEQGAVLSAEDRRFVLQEKEYLAVIEPVMAFLRGSDGALAQGICSGMLPEGARFAELPDLDWLFGTMGITDRAKYLASVFLEELVGFITRNVDGDFGLSRYAEQIAIALEQFSDIEEALEKSTLVTDFLEEVLLRQLERTRPKVVGLSVPFPGNLKGALLVARKIKEVLPEVAVFMGGGFVNTELRSLNEPALFNYVDFVCLDDGERPLEMLLKYLLMSGDKSELVRTFVLEGKEVVFYNSAKAFDYSHDEIGVPDYEGLPLEKYVSVISMANPMHRLWSDGRWNKLTLAHGCYWHKCSFCDTSLDYIGRYSGASAKILCDRIEQVIEQTGQRGFHFVDEAAPPKVLKELSQELIRRGVRISWWTNVRFEKSFTSELVQLMARAGCVAVSGGLEVASDRLLKMMSKGVSIEQVAGVAQDFTQGGIMVHAYLMYGFPTQTVRETIDALEVVRQLFENGLIQSGFWHQFSMTVHSPVGLEPDKFKVKRIELPENSFARNGCLHEDETGCLHEKFSFGLKKALYNYMHEMCFEMELQEWFDFKVPRTTIPPNYIRKILRKRAKQGAKRRQG